MDKYGTPGFGKSQVLFLLNKPKWMPLWLHRWREKRAWLRWGKGNFVFIVPTKLDPSDLAMPFNPLRKHLHTVAPRPWPKKENDDA